MGNLATTMGVRKGGGAAQKKENGGEKEHFHPAPAFQSGGWQRHSSTAF